MGSLLSLRTAALLVFVTIAQANGAELQAAKSTLDRLAALHPGETFALDGFPVGAERNTAIRFQRVQIYAPDAHIYLVGADGRKELPRSNRIYLRGYADDGSARVAMSLNADGSFADGNGSGPDGSFVVHARIDVAGAHRFTAQALEDALPSGYKYDFRCGNEGQSMLFHNPEDLMQKGALSAGSPASVTSAPSTFRFATVAVDTDALFMSQLFSNNTTSATTWIAKMFNTMNTMYEPDLNVALVQGTTFLRTGSDPYGSASNVPADGTDLNVFGAYWKTNYSSVKRAFATLLSGRGPCTPCGTGCTSCSASGIAWIDQYCQKGFANFGNTVGSYSVVQVFASQTIDPNANIAARLTGHELGHNFGADHTHCTDKTSGLSPVATNTIDQCYNGESSSGCYAGSQVCPAGGKGTIMSYCNIGACAGTQNLLQFNATQISKTLTPNVGAATPSCLFVDLVFANGFN